MDYGKFRIVDRLDSPWVARINPDGTRTILVRKGEILRVGLVRRLQAWAADGPAAPGATRPASEPPRVAERNMYGAMGGAACATVPRISLAALRQRHSGVVMTVHTDRGLLVIGDQLTRATTLAVAASVPPVIGAGELDPPAAPSTPAPAADGSSLAGRRLGHTAARRRAHRWVSVAVLAVGSLWVADSVDDQPADGRYGVSEDARMEAVTVVTHAPPQTWPRITAY